MLQQEFFLSVGCYFSLYPQIGLTAKNIQQYLPHLFLIQYQILFVYRSGKKPHIKGGQFNNRIYLKFCIMRHFGCHI